MKPGADKALDQLIDEVRLLWNSLVRSGERLHVDEPITMGMRAVLEYLGRNGPTAVPSIARSRRVSRQHIQAQVNALLDEGCVEFQENPAHKRSALVALSARGRRTLDRMRRREAAALGDAPIEASPAQLEHAAGLLRAVREALDPD
jgi:DNA-binding MarR family transcriptional regulator